MKDQTLHNEDFKHRLERCQSDLSDKSRQIEKKDLEIGKARDRLNELEREIIKYKE